MLKFVVRRSGQAVFVLLATTFLMYVGVLHLGNPFANVGEKTIPPETQAVLRAKFGLDEPFFVQYLVYLKNLVTGDLGIDFDQRRPVFDLLAAAAPNTVGLALLAFAINVVIGTLAGVIAAVWRDSFWDVLVTVSSVLVLCIPIFVAGFALRASLSGLHLFGLEIFPLIPHSFTVEVPWYKEALLPALVLAIGDVAFIARLMRASMLDVLHADYLHTARAKGLPERTVILKHAVRNAIVPVVNHAGLYLGALMGGAVIIETIFQYRGLGYLFIRSIQSTNNPVVLAIAVLAVITFVVLVAIADILCAYLDPRIRLN